MPGCHDLDAMCPFVVSEWTIVPDRLIPAWHVLCVCIHVILLIIMRKIANTRCLLYHNGNFIGRSLTGHVIGPSCDYDVIGRLATKRHILANATLATTTPGPSCPYPSDSNPPDATINPSSLSTIYVQSYFSVNSNPILFQS